LFNYEVPLNKSLGIFSCEQSTSSMRMWKNRIVQETVLEKRKAAGWSRGLARRLGKNHSLLFSLAPRLSFFVRNSAVFSGRQVEEGRGKIWESVIGKNRRWRLLALNNKGAYDHVPSSLECSEFQQNVRFFLIRARSSDFENVNIFCQINFECEWYEARFFINFFFKILCYYTIND